MTRDVDAELLAADVEAYRLAVEIETLEALWPSAQPAARRAAMVEALGTAFRQLEECYQTIINLEARTPAGAAAKLRRALSLARTLREMPGDHSAGALAKLIEDALAVLEAEASAAVADLGLAIETRRAELAEAERELAAVRSTSCTLLSHAEAVLENAKADAKVLVEKAIAEADMIREDARADRRQKARRTDG